MSLSLQETQFWEHTVAVNVYQNGYKGEQRSFSLEQLLENLYIAQGAA